MQGKLLSLAIFVVLLAGCPGTLQNEPELSYKPDKVIVPQKFIEAGCVKTGDYQLNCETAQQLSGFKCELKDIDIRSELEPQLGLIVCVTDIRANNLTDEDWKDNYFYCDGGLAPWCTSYLTSKDGKFARIKNSKELLGLISPIDNAEKALGLVLLAKPRISKNAYADGKTVLEGSSKESGDGFLVTAYTVDSIFGCKDSYNYYKVQYLVSKDGTMTEKSRGVIYTKRYEGTLCVD